MKILTSGNGCLQPSDWIAFVCFLIFHTSFSSTFVEVLKFNSTNTGNSAAAATLACSCLSAAAWFLVAHSTAVSTTFALLRRWSIKLRGWIICICLLAATLWILTQHDADSPFLLSKHNFLNRVVVRYGWGLAFIYLACQAVLTTYIVGGKNWLHQLKTPAFRLAFASTLWFALTKSMTLVRNRSGMCALGSLKNESALEGEQLSTASYRICHRLGGEWTGFDASGHVFLMTFNLLVMAQEAGVFSLAVKFRNRKLGKKVNLTRLHNRFDKVKQLSRLCRVVGACLMALWTTMLLTTGLFFHTLAEKLVGYLMAVIAWWSLYAIAQLLNPNMTTQGMMEVDSQLQPLVENLHDDGQCAVAGEKKHT